MYEASDVVNDAFGVAALENSPVFLHFFYC